MKKTLSFLLIFVFLLGVLPVQAEEEGVFTYRALIDPAAIITGYTGEIDGELIIPDTIDGLPVIAIAGDAFEEREDITSLRLPEGLQDIGQAAFKDCRSLTEVSLPSTLKDVGNYAFASCTALTEIAIPGNYTRIGAHAFGHCPSLTTATLKEGVRSIEDYAFANCTALGEMTIPDSVEQMGKYVFYESALAAESRWQQE